MSPHPQLFAEFQQSAPEVASPDENSANVEYYKPEQHAAEFQQSAPEVVPRGENAAAVEYYKPDRNAVEFQQSAPEVVPSDENAAALEYYKPEEGVAAPTSAATLPKKRRRILGLRPLLWGILILVVIVIAVAVAVPVAVTSKHNSPSSPSSNSNPSSTSSTPSPTSATTTSSPSASPTSIKLISANYGGVDETSNAVKSFTQGNSLYINMNNVSLPDTWLGVEKCLSILHSFGSSIRTFVECDDSGAFTLNPGPPDNNSTSQEITRQGPSTANFSIVSVVWGSLEIRDPVVYQTMLDYKQNGSSLVLSNSLFQEDTLVGSAKSAVIWYTEDNFQTFPAIFGRESDSIHF